LGGGSLKVGDFVADGRAFGRARLDVAPFVDDTLEFEGADVKPAGASLEGKTEQVRRQPE
jgi:hypothetical protein